MPSNTRLSITFLLALSLVLAYSTNSKTLRPLQLSTASLIRLYLSRCDYGPVCSADGAWAGDRRLLSSFSKATRRAVFLAEMARILL
jgi:hypothetical protein